MDEQTNEKVNVTWIIALKIWWWITWRTVLASILGGFLAGFVFGVIAAVVGINPETAKIISGFIGVIVGISINIFFFKEIIGKKFSDFTLILTKPK